jgi:uncharacterized membrane protein
MTTHFKKLMPNEFSDLNSLYLTLQISILALFLIAIYRASRVSRPRVFELITAFIFGLLLEEGDILTFKTYHYDPHWVLLDQVPPAIALCWALIIASAMNFSDALGIDERIAPFTDALWAILLDLSLDAVAIRLGFWTWTTTPLTGGWFGVPWGNFYAWLGVAASFPFSRTQCLTIFIFAAQDWNGFCSRCRWLLSRSSRFGR